MIKSNPRTNVAACCVCLSSLLSSGCQLQQALQRFTASSRPEDPAYLLDPATEARQLAEMSSQTRDDLNAFTDRSASEMAASVQNTQNAAAGTAAAYFAQTNATQHNGSPATQGQGAAFQAQPTAPIAPHPVQNTEITANDNNSYAGLSRYPLSAVAGQPTAGSGSMYPASTLAGVAQASGAEPASPPVQPAAAAISVRGVTPGAGPVRVAIFDSASSFPNRNAAQSKFSVDSSATQINAPLVTQSSTVAVAVFQDLNNDGKLNRSAFGIPTEPYGFSGANSRSLGPPSFKEAAVMPNGSVEVLLTK